MLKKLLLLSALTLSCSALNAQVVPTWESLSKNYQVPVNGFKIAFK